MLLNQTLKILFLGLYLSVCQGFGQAGKVRIIRFEDLRKMMNHVSDTTLVVHFWATWCKPCVEELPSLDKLSREYAPKKIRFVMVSMDFPKDIKEKVIPFVTINNINSEVVLLDEPDYNAWIDDVDKQWSGTIPATLILNLTMRKRIFFEGQANLRKLMEELTEITPVEGDN